MENFLPINCRNELGVIVFYDTEPSLGLEHAFLVILKGTLEIGLRYGGGEEGCDDMKNVSHVRMTKGHDIPWLKMSPSVQVRSLAPLKSIGYTLFSKIIKT